MNKSEIKNGLCIILNTNFKEFSGYNSNSKLDDIGFTSLDILEFGFYIETYFNVSLENSIIHTFKNKTLIEITEFLYTKLNN